MEVGNFEQWTKAHGEKLYRHLAVIQQSNVNAQNALVNKRNLQVELHNWIRVAMVHPGEHANRLNSNYANEAKYYTATISSYLTEFGKLQQSIVSIERDLTEGKKIVENIQKELLERFPMMFNPY